MAALRIGIHDVIIPEENEKDLKDIDPLVRKALNFITTDHVDNILDVALTRRPDSAPGPERAEETAGVKKPLPLPEPSGRARAELRP